MSFGRRAAVAINCAVVAASGVAVSPASAVTKPGVVIDYGNTRVVVKIKPKTIWPYKDLHYTGIRWTKLAGNIGYATAIRHINSCVPSCADANYIDDKVWMTFSRVRTTSTKRQVFTRVRVTVVKTHKADLHPLPLEGYGE